MSRSNVSDILAFLAVVDASSFVGGAKVLGLSRSTTGKAMARLEQRLGVRLVHRTTRSFSLTDEGRIFAEQCKALIAGIEDAEAAVKTASMVPSGLLRVSVPDAFGRLFVLPIIDEYMNDWPDLRVEMSFTDRAADIILDGIDLAIRIGTTVTDTRSDSQLIARVVAEFETMLVASPSYLKRHPPLADPEDLAGHDGLLFGSGTHRHVWRLREAGGEWVRVSPKCRLRVDSGAAQLSFAVAGRGIAYLPKFLCDAAIRSGSIVRVLPAFETESARISVIYPTKQHLSAKVRRLIDLIEARWQGMRPRDCGEDEGA